MKYFWELHNKLPQQGPGDNQTTETAFYKINSLPNHPQILDIGCGPGRQTIALANNSNGLITAVDNHQPFLDELNQKAIEQQLTNRIKTINQSMDDLNLAPESFDLIWSEGAIYIIGFENGLISWKKFLRPGGFIAVTELSWLGDKLPNEIKSYWDTNYSAMISIEENRALIKKAGYCLIDSFVLDNECWYKYYQPIRKRIKEMRNKYEGVLEAITFLDEYQKELDMFDKYSENYGYVFYIMSLK